MGFLTDYTISAGDTFLKFETLLCVHDFVVDLCALIFLVLPREILPDVSYLI